MGQDEAVTITAKDTEAGNTDTDVGMEVHSTAREHRGQGRNEECVMWSHENLRMSVYSKVDIDAQVEPSEGKCEMERGSTPRYLGRGDGRAEGGTHAAREGRNPACDRSDRESNWRTCTANEGRVTGSATLFERATTTDRGRRCEHRVWWIGWSQRFENMRRIWLTGRLQWFMWIGWHAQSGRRSRAKSTRTDVQFGGGGCREDFQPW